MGGTRKKTGPKRAKAKAEKRKAKASIRKPAKPAPKKKAAKKKPAQAKKRAAPAKKKAAPGKKALPAKPAPKPSAKAALKKPAAPVKTATPLPPKSETPPADPVKRPARPFFLEVKPGSERVIKRGDKSLATPASLDIQARRKGTTAEESPEELVERIERELEHQFFAKRNVLRPQQCTKCGVNPVAPRFTIDRELGYCSACAEILRLGETKEARRMEYNPLVAKPAEEAAKPAPGEGEAGGGDGGPDAVPDAE